LLSVSDVLERLGVDAKIGRVQKDKINEVTFPYLLFLNNENRGFSLIKKQDDLDQLKDEIDFAKDIILKAEKPKEVKDKGNQEQYSKDRFFGLASTLIVITGLILLSVNTIPSFSIATMFFLLSVIAGVSVGYVLVAKEVGVTYKAVEEFCGAGKRVNCDAVLNSEGATLFGHLTLSDSVLGYFIFQAVIATFLLPNEALYPTYLVGLAVFGTVSILVVGYSVYYQAVKVKSWCKLCLAVGSILIAQFLFFAHAYYTGVFTLNDITPPSIINMVLLFGITGLSVLVLKDKVKTANEVAQSEARSNQIKYSPEVFTSLLLKQRKVDVSFFEEEILLGEYKAPVRITMASNMFCNPCKRQHELLSELLAIYPAKVCISVRFLPARDIEREGKETINPRAYLMSYWYRHISGRKNASEKTVELIHDWFETKDIEVFSQQYLLNQERGNPGDQVITGLLSRHNAWVEQTHISKTPTLFVNGYEMPVNYTVDDLKAMIPGLTESIPNVVELKSKTISHKSQ